MHYTFTEADIRAGTSGQSFSRGMSYYAEGAVLEIVQRGAGIAAEVEGSESEPYAVTITLDAQGAIANAVCTCPYSTSSYCKHTVAVLLAVLHDAEAIQEKPDLSTLLDGLNEVQLRQIIVSVAAEDLHLGDRVERAVAALRRTASAAGDLPPVPPHVDGEAIRRDMRRRFRQAASDSGSGRRDGYGYGYDEFYIDAAAIIEPAVQAADALLNSGAPTGAVTLLTDVIAEWSECIAHLEEWILEGNQDAFDEAAREFDALLAESLLSLPLTADERKVWWARIDELEDETADLTISRTALEQGWDYPPLVAVLQGNITAKGAWEGESPGWADQLACARLRVLERQGRIAEYLNLAQAESQLVLYLSKLIQIGEIARTVAAARAYLGDPNELLAIARLLDERGHHTEALEVAAHGLDLGALHGEAALARWLALRAHALGASDLALRAAQVTFDSSHQLADYQTARTIAGERWHAVKPALLENLARANAYTDVEIYLHENMLIEAMQAVDKRGGYSASVERVIEAVCVEHPEWAIKQCKMVAERTMNNGDAKHYANAAEWLRRARTIYAQHDRLAEWQRYLRELLDVHARKYKLVPMLKEIQ